MVEKPKPPTLQFRYPDTTAPGACPTCNASGNDPCLSRGARDHAGRRRAA
jgi:hypothetical protein